MRIDGQVLLAARALAGLSQERLARETGIHTNSLKKIERGAPTTEVTWLKLEDALARLGVGFIKSSEADLVGVRRLEGAAANRNPDKLRAPASSSRGSDGAPPAGAVRDRQQRAPGSERGSVSVTGRNPALR